MADHDPALGWRILSSVILVPVVLALVVVSSWSFALLVVVSAVLLALEWRHMMAARFGRGAGDLAGAVAGAVAVLVAVLALLGLTKPALALAFLGALLGGIVASLLVAAPFWVGLGTLYLSLPMLALIWLRAVPDIGLALVLWLLAVVWTTDIMAYFVGRGVGGARLAPAISPSKTWSGLCGGVAGAALVGGGVALTAGPFRFLPAVALAAALAIVAQTGDLAESALKRRAGVKDSGSVIPGHGGLFDRVDGMLFAAPVLALVVLAARQRGWP